MSTNACHFSMHRHKFVYLVLLLAPAVYANVPTCLNDNSDPDGDGWGWENSASCKVDHKPPCLDPDEDGWGWDGTQSCRSNIETDKPPPQQQTGLAAELVGTWQCYVGALVPDWYLFRNFAMETNDGLAFAGGCHQIGILTRVLEGSQCDISWQSLMIQYSHRDGAFNAHLSRLVLNDDLTGTFQDGQVQTRTGEAYYANPNNINWKMEGYQLTIDNTPAHRIAFESWNGNEYFSYYNDDENRTTCKRENQ